MKKLITKLLSGAFWVSLFISVMNSDKTGPILGIAFLIFGIIFTWKILKSKWY